MTDSSERPELVSVAAVAANGVIGDDGELPWPSIPADKQQYRDRIAEWPVVLGRATFESMLDDLPGSAQVVLSRSDRDYDLETAYDASGVEDTVDVVRSLMSERAYVIGGGGIYELFQPHVDRMALSRLPEAYEGDTVFPEWDESEWTRVDQTEYDRFTLEEWERIETK